MNFIKFLLFSLINPIYPLKPQQMHESYMFQNRFAPGMGGYGVAGRFGNAFDMHSSAQYRQFHEMKAEMPSDVLELFKANQIGFLKAPVKPKCRPLDPILTMKIDLMQMFQIPNLELIQQEKKQTKDEKIARINQQKKQLNQNRIKTELIQWNPFEDDKIPNSDPEKTLLVARLNYKTKEDTLKFQFEKYGLIKSVRIIKDEQGNSRGYGFVEFDSKDDFFTAYKKAYGKRIEERRILVDYERGRTVLTWRPRRFGQGAGTSRLTRQQLEKFRALQKQKRQQDQKERKKSPGRHSRSRSPRRQKRRDQNDERDRRRRDSKERKELRRDGKRDAGRR